MIRSANAVAASTMLAAMIFMQSCVSSDRFSVSDRVSAPSEPLGVMALASKPAGAVSTEQVYMFRGGFNGVFSTGINVMAAELEKKGITVHAESWSAGASSLNAIKASYAANGRSGPVVIAGHSLGAFTAMGLANQLSAKGIPVDLVILFDPLSPSAIPTGVRKLINYRASGRKGDGGNSEPGPRSNGNIVNVDIRTLPELGQANHWNIVNQPALQKLAVQEIVRVVNAGTISFHSPEQ